jgi:hypothetical protein
VTAFPKTVTPNAPFAMAAERRFGTSLKRLNCANSGHSERARRTHQIDPKRKLLLSFGTGKLTQ